MRTTVRSVRGMSLVEVLVVASILAFISLVVATTFSDIFRLQTHVLSRDEVNEFGASLGRFLFTESTCSSALAPNSFPAGGGPVDIRIAGYTGYAAGAMMAHTAPAGSKTPLIMDLQSGVEITPRMRIRSITIEDKRMPPQAVLANGANLMRYLAQVRLIMEVREKDGEWRGTPPRTYEFPVLVDPANGNSIRRCYIEMKVSDACQVLGTVLDPTTGKCVPLTQCIFEGHYTTNTCNPGGFGCPPGLINELTGGQSCPSGVSTGRETGVYDWSYVVSCGKKCTQTVFVQTRYFVCLRCNNTP